MLKKAYAKTAALRKLKRFLPIDTLIALYKAYVLPNLEYCSPILLGISKSLNKKLENANHYAIRSLCNLEKTITYEHCPKIH